MQENSLSLSTSFYILHIQEGAIPKIVQQNKCLLGNVHEKFNIFDHISITCPRILLTTWRIQFVIPSLDVIYERAPWIIYRGYVFMFSQQ